MGIFELFWVDDAVRQLITASAGITTLRAEAQRLRMRTLQQEGESLLKRGVTSRVELERALGTTEVLL